MAWKTLRPPEERIAEMQMIVGQSRFAPFGLPFPGLKELMEGKQSVPAGLGCALTGEWEAGAERHYVTEADERHQGHGLENGSEPHGSETRRPANGEDLADQR